MDTSSYAYLYLHTYITLPYMLCPYFIFLAILTPPYLCVPSQSVVYVCRERCKQSSRQLSIIVDYWANGVIWLHCLYILASSPGSGPVGSSTTSLMSSRKPIVHYYGFFSLGGFLQSVCCVLYCVPRPCPSLPAWIRLVPKKLGVLSSRRWIG